MKKSLSLLVILFSFSALASECKSVDLTIAEYKMGFSSADDISVAIECNLNQSTRPKQLCHTKIGLKKDQLVLVKLMRGIGAATEQDVEQVQEQVTKLISNCQ